MTKTALIIVDCQYDFIPPDGCLAVPGGDQILDPIKQLLNPAEWDWDLVVASQDYHPPKHISFANRHPGHKPFEELELTDARGRTYSQTLWPDHCVQGTKGAEIEKSLREAFEPWKAKGKIKIVRKAWHPDIEAYSAFEGYITEATDPAEPPKEDLGAKEIHDQELTNILEEKYIEKVVVVGLATDFCVYWTARDCVSTGLPTAVVVPLIRGVEQEKSKSMLDDVQKRGGYLLARDGGDWQSAIRDWSK